MSSPRSIRPRGRIVVVVTLLAVTLVAVTLAVVTVVRSPAHAPDRPAATPAAQPVVVADEPPVLPPSALAPPHDAVAAAGPTRFRFAAPGIGIDARVCPMSNARPLDPPGEQHHTVCWVREQFGEAPGSASATTYVLGHSWAPDPHEVLNRLSAPATEELLAAAPVRVDGVQTYPIHRFDGATITLWTPKGRLDYRVRDAYGVDKYDLGSVRHTMDDRVRNRVVLITCAERAGRDYHDNVVVEAYLATSRSATSRSATSRATA